MHYDTAVAAVADAKAKDPELWAPNPDGSCPFDLWPEELGDEQWCITIRMGLAAWRVYSPDEIWPSIDQMVQSLRRMRGVGAAEPVPEESG